MTEQKQCIADIIELHVRHILDKLELNEESIKIAIEITKELRGDIFVVGKSPKSVAAAIVLVAIRSSGEYNPFKSSRGRILSALDISRAIGTAEVSGHHMFHQLIRCPIVYRIISQKPFMDSFGRYPRT